MPKLSTTAETEPDIELTEQQRAELVLNLSTYGKLLTQMDDLQADIEAQKAELNRLRDALGTNSIGIEKLGRVTLVTGGTTKRLMRKKLLANGVTLAQLEAATVEKPKKDYTLVTIAGRKSREHAEEEE